MGLLGHKTGSSLVNQKTCHYLNRKMDHKSRGFFYQGRSSYYIGQFKYYRKSRWILLETSGWIDLNTAVLCQGEGHWRIKLFLGVDCGWPQTKTSTPSQKTNEFVPVWKGCHFNRKWNIDSNDWFSGDVDLSFPGSNIFTKRLALIYHAWQKGCQQTSVTLTNPKEGILLSLTNHKNPFQISIFTKITPKNTNTLPETSSPLKINGWWMIFPFEALPIFRGGYCCCF